VQILLTEFQNEVVMKEGRERVKIFTWHIHGSYLYYLSQGNFEIFIPVNDERSEGYIGYGSTFPFRQNVHEIDVKAVKDLTIDCILFQSPQTYLKDQYEIFSDAQRRLPKIYLEHDPPQGHPTNTSHVVRDPFTHIVHVTHFNQLMWDNNGIPSTVIDHGILPSSVNYSGELGRGLVIINNLKDRGRRLGLDIFLEARKHVPLDLIGMNTEELGGLGEVLHPRLPEFISRYRFLFNPIRYTSLGLAVLEAMMAGVPVVGMATTEMVTVFTNGVTGYVHTDLSYLISKMTLLLEDKVLAEQLGAEGKQLAMDRFNISRFIKNWDFLFRSLINETHERRRPEYDQHLQNQL
jgi:glycosyltransferase involved in cell wall biosynthesis